MGSRGEGLGFRDRRCGRVRWKRGGFGRWEWRSLVLVVVMVGLFVVIRSKWCILLKCLGCRGRCISNIINGIH